MFEIKDLNCKILTGSKIPNFDYKDRIQKILKSLETLHKTILCVVVDDHDDGHFLKEECKGGYYRGIGSQERRELNGCDLIKEAIDIKNTAGHLICLAEMCHKDEMLFTAVFAHECGHLRQSIKVGKSRFSEDDVERLKEKWLNSVKDDEKRNPPWEIDADLFMYSVLAKFYSESQIDSFLENEISVGRRNRERVVMIRQLINTGSTYDFLEQLTLDPSTASRT